MPDLKDTTITFRLPAALKRLVVDAAADADRSVSFIVCKALMAWLLPAEEKTQ